MNRQSLIVVSIVTLIALVAAISVQRHNKPASDVTARSGSLLPQLASGIDSLDRIRLAGAGDSELVTLEKAGSGWVVANRGGFPADAAKLRELVLALVDAKTIEAKTANPERHAMLGVEDIGKPDAKGVLVELSGLSQPARIVIGNVNGAGGGTFVRRADEPQSWLVGGTLSIERDPSAWIARDVAGIPSNRIHEVVIDRGKSSLTVTKPTVGDGNFTIANLPKGREPSSEFAANPLASMLAELRIDDVIPAADAIPPADAIKGRYTLFDGIIVDASAWTVDGKHRLQLIADRDHARSDVFVAAEQAAAVAAFDAAKPAEGESEPTPPLAKTDPAKDAAERIAAIDAEVTALNARFSGWTFVIPAYKFDTINKSIDDLLAEAPSKSAKSGK